MRVAGKWVGLGLGDSSDEIRAIKQYMRGKFASYAGNLTDTTLYDAPMVDAVTEMQRRYSVQNRIGPHTPGIINLETKYAMGWLPRPTRFKPVIFSIEGHMSNMWIGPCADTARILEQQGVCRWQPIGYDTVALPFNNASGINEFVRLLEDRTLLPPGTPWALACYSQGAIVGTETWIQHIQPKHGRLHWRLPDWRGTLAFGSPYRERDRVAEWVVDPPRPGTEGISPKRMVNTPPHWKDVARRGDLYTEVDGSGDHVEHKRAVYMAVQNQWSGHPDALLSQLIEISERPVPEMLAVIQAITNGVMFLGNMAPHGGYDLRPGIEFLRQRLER